MQGTRKGRPVEHLRVIRSEEAIAGEGTISKGARARILPVLGHFVREIESVDVEQLVEHAHVIALEPLEPELEDEVGPEGAEPAVLQDVALVDLAEDGAPEARRLGLVVGVLGEAEAPGGVQLAQVDDYRGVAALGELRAVEDPEAVDRHGEGAREVGRGDDAPAGGQVATAARPTREVLPIAGHR
jgi:hypothetical protein